MKCDECNRTNVEVCTSIQFKRVLCLDCLERLLGLKPKDAA